jgi:ribonucleoside-diphosphate reductase alpha chain
MAILRIDHPDIEEFITAKSNPLELNTFNISVAVTDEFMERVKRGEQYSLINPRTREVVKRLDARDVLDRIVEAAWRNGEPGVIFSIGLIEITLPPSWVRSKALTRAENSRYSL